MIIDTHAHLYFPELISNIDKVIDDALSNGIEKIIIPAVDLKTIDIALNISAKFNMVFTAAGFHPSDIKDLDEKELLELESKLKESKIVAVGEIGLDYYWDKSYIDKQKYFFKSQIEIAQQNQLPIIIHTRVSVQDAIDIVKNYKDLYCQFHCFSGNSSELKEILTLKNSFVSYCGNITYKKFSSINLIEETPIERLLAETDSPFLTPVPFRGKPNQPAYLKHTIKKIAEVKKIDEAILTSDLLKNTRSIFGL